jgi:hypothetical protein
MEWAKVPTNRWIEKENGVGIHTGVLLSHKEECNFVIFSKMDGTKDHHVKWNKPDSESKYHIFIIFRM